MKDVFKTYRPDGFSTVNAYLMVEKPVDLIEFLKQAFYAEEIQRTTDENDVITNCIVKIGDSCFMVSQAKNPFLGMKTSFYLYVADVDSMHENAIKHGAVEVFKPWDMEYGDRQSGVIDPSGNYWWISKRLREETY